MRLNMQDKIDIREAVVKATDLETFRRWIVSLVDAADAAATDARADGSFRVPPYPPEAGRPGPSVRSTL
jgi:hypothetical protein